MTEGCWFVVERRHGRLSGSLYYDCLPDKYRGKYASANGLHYAKRIDVEPHLATLTRQQLYDAWELLGGLPSKQDLADASP